MGLLYVRDASEWLPCITPIPTAGLRPKACDTGDMECTSDRITLRAIVANRSKYPCVGPLGHSLEMDSSRSSRCWNLQFTVKGAFG